MPTDPADLKAWLAGLPPEDLLALTQQVGAGLFAGSLTDFGGFGRRNREIDLPAKSVSEIGRAHV